MPLHWAALLDPSTYKHAVLFFKMSDQGAHIPSLPVLSYDPYDPNNEELSASKHNVTLAQPLLSSFSDPFELEIEDIYHRKNKSSLSIPRSKEILAAVYLVTIIKLYLILVKKKKIHGLYCILFCYGRYLPSFESCWNSFPSFWHALIAGVQIQEPTTAHTWSLLRRHYLMVPTD